MSRKHPMDWMATTNFLMMDAAVIATFHPVPSDPSQTPVTPEILFARALCHFASYAPRFAKQIRLVGNLILHDSSLLVPEEFVLKVLAGNVLVDEALQPMQALSYNFNPEGC